MLQNSYVLKRLGDNNKPGNVRKHVKLRCAGVTIVSVEKQ